MLVVVLKEVVDLADEALVLLDEASQLGVLRVLAGPEGPLGSDRAVFLGVAVDLDQAVEVLNVVLLVDLVLDRAVLGDRRQQLVDLEVSQLYVVGDLLRGGLQPLLREVDRVVLGEQIVDEVRLIPDQEVTFLELASVHPIDEEVRVVGRQVTNEVLLLLGLQVLARVAVAAENVAELAALLDHRVPGATLGALFLAAAG